MSTITSGNWRSADNTATAPKKGGLTAAQLADLAGADPADPRQRGQLMFMRNKCDQSARGQQHRALLDQLLAQPARQVTTTAPRLPWQGVTRRHDRERRELTAVDVAWLTRLPTDPGALAEVDIRALAQMVVDADPRSSDARLLDSVFAPIQQHYERRVAEANAATVRAVVRSPAGPVAGVEDVLAEALLEDEPAIGEREARARARETITAQVERQQRQARALLDQADADVARVAAGQFDPIRRVATAGTYQSSTPEADRYEPREERVELILPPPPVVELADDDIEEFFAS